MVASAGLQHDGAAGRIRVGAPETFAFTLPTLALVPAVLFAAHVYSAPNLEYTHCPSREVPAAALNASTPGEAPPAFNPVTHAYIGSTQIVEPFRTATNLCYWVAGVGVLMHAVVNGAVLHPQAFLLAALFAFLGAGSAMMHASGGHLGTWSHAVRCCGRETWRGVRCIARAHPSPVSLPRDCRWTSLASTRSSSPSRRPRLLAFGMRSLVARIRSREVSIARGS